MQIELVEKKRRSTENGEENIQETSLMGGILDRKSGYVKRMGYGVVIPSAANNFKATVSSTARAVQEELSQYKENLHNAND